MPGKGRPFEKGKVSNPKGRPKSHLSKLLSAHLQEKVKVFDAAGKTITETREKSLVRKVYALAFTGDMDAIKFIWERMEGKVRDNIDLTSGGQTIKDLVLDYPGRESKE